MLLLAGVGFHTAVLFSLRKECALEYGSFTAAVGERIQSEALAFDARGAAFV